VSSRAAYSSCVAVDVKLDAAGVNVVFRGWDAVWAVKRRLQIQHPERARLAREISERIGS